MGEKRTAPRQRVLKGGRIVFNSGRSTIDCTVRNLSPGGAKLGVASVVGIPDRFSLLLTGNEAPRACRVTWRRANDLGVAFVSD
jgi:hypothetical protein